jgi:hypothetical protein
MAVQHQAGNTVVLVLQPRRVLKGNIEPWLDDWSTLSVACDAGVPPGGLLDCPYGLWFLASESEKPWHWSVLAPPRAATLIKAMLRLLAGEPPPQYRREPRDALADLLAKEMWNGADSGTDELAAAGLAGPK